MSAEKQLTKPHESTFEMPKFLVMLLAATLAITSNIPAFAQYPNVQQRLEYADLADLVVDAPLIAHITVKQAIKVAPERAISAPPGTQRFYIVATTNTLIRGQGGIPDTIRYLIDLPLNDRGKAPKIKKQQFLIFAKPIAGRPADVQLIGKESQISWTPERDVRIRALVTEVVSRDAPPAISGIAGAFHVPGTIIGEGETQIFMDTKGQVPVSISVLSRDGQRKTWAVSLGEIVDEAAQAPVRNSLLWYRLACFLPRELPYSALGDVDPSIANQARRDYQLVIRDLGNCPRSRPPSHQF